MTTTVMKELIVDNFAGGGGASTGLEMAGLPVDIAINHDPVALGMHAANHPNTRHIISDVFDVDPREVTDGRSVGLAWFSPDCKHFSKAKGGKPVEKKIRGLAWVALKWAVSVRPRIICLENVEEFEDWGPLLLDGKPCPERKGQIFNLFVKRFEQAGYCVEWRQHRACNYGAPTIRKRLIVIMRCDGLPIIWPDPTHGDPTGLEVVSGLLHPWRTAAECINWSIRCPSIFERKRPLVENTLRRIARGIQRFVIEADDPFIVPAFISYGQHGGRNRDINQPHHTITASRKDTNGLVTAFLAQHNTGATGHDARKPLSTITGRGTQQQAVAAFLTKFYGTCNHGSSLRQPFPTVTATGTHIGEVRAFLMKYYGMGGQWQDCREPMHTISTKDRLGLVTIAGEEWQIVDIGMRMLSARELFRAQGFDDSYIIQRQADGTPITKTQQVEKCGNSVPPPLAQAIAHANFNNQAMRISA